MSSDSGNALTQKFLMERLQRGRGVIAAFEMRR